MSTVGPEYATTHRLVALEQRVGPQPVPVPPGPHGWRLCAATAVMWVVDEAQNSHQVLYTWFWRRAGRERVAGALGGDGDPQ